MITYDSFKTIPAFVIDYLHQPVPIKTLTVYIKLEFEPRTTFMKSLKVYALGKHDTVVNYSAFDGSVKTSEPVKTQQLIVR